MLEAFALTLAVLLLLFVFRNKFYEMFFVILLTTEFFYVPVGGGIARLYHFFALLVLLLLFRHLPKLFDSKVFWALLVFVGINFCAIVFSGAPSAAMKSFFAVISNIGVAMATALILVAGKVNLTTLKKVILTVTLLSILWGLIQIVAYRFGGLNLALAYEQIRQISDGFGPAFRTEANTFGKYMVLPFLLFLPEYIEHKRIKNINWVYLAFLVGILMNFTRTSIYGTGVALFFVFFWYAKNGKLSLLSQKSVKMAVVIAVGIVLVNSGVLNISDYAVYKINNLFNQEEILEGGSSGFRLDMMRFVVDDALTDSKKMLIGNGWGQTFHWYHGRDVRAGGGDIISILGYAGLFGVCGYLLYMIAAFNASRKTSVKGQSCTTGSFAEGVMFALIGVFCVGQMAGYIIMPEYWLLIGLAIYLSLNISTQETPAVLKEAR